MDPLQQQAQLEASIKYNPQIRALQGMLGQLGAGYQQQVQSAQGAARSMQAAADQAAPVVQRVYDQADQSRQQSLGDVNQQFAQLGPAANIFKAALAREQLQAGSNLGQSRADALSELQRRKVEAGEGALFAQQNAGRQYLSSILQVANQLAGLAGDQGSFAQATLSALQNAQANRNVTIRGQNLQHQDRVASQGIAQQRANTSASRGSSGGGASNSQYNSMLNQAKYAMSTIGQLQGAGIPEGTIRQLLIGGHTTRGGTSIHQTPADMVEAAYEARGWGVITPNTASTLRARGLDPNRFASGLGVRVGNPPHSGPIVNIPGLGL